MKKCFSFCVLLSVVSALFALSSAGAVTVRFGEDITIEGSEMDYHHTEFQKDPNNSEPLPSQRAATSQGNTASVSLSASPQHAGVAQALIGAELEWQYDPNQWENIKSSPVNLTLDYSYQISASYREGSGSANAGIQIWGFTEGWHEFVGYAIGSSGSRGKQVSETYQFAFQDLVGKGNIIFEAYSQIHIICDEDEAGNPINATHRSSAKVTVNRIKIEFAPPPPPTASFTHSPNYKLGHEIEFDPSSSDANGDEIVMCRWDFGDGYTALGVAGEKVRHTYSSPCDDPPCEYTVTLTVENSWGDEDSTQKTLMFKPFAVCSPPGGYMPRIVPIGQFHDYIFKIWNIGNSVLDIEKISISVPSDFELVSEKCTKSGLKPAASDIRTIKVRFLPKREGVSKAFLTIESNDDYSPLSIVLAGEGKKKDAQKQGQMISDSINIGEKETGKTRIIQAIPPIPGAIYKMIIDCSMSGMAVRKDRGVSYTETNDIGLFNYVFEEAGMYEITITITYDEEIEIDPDSIVLDVSMEEDCNGELGGTAFIDACGECVGGSTGWPPCIPSANDGSGIFTVGETGVVSADWLYDGGAYKGELGIFSLAGMDLSVPDLTAFIAEAVQRVLSNSENGYIALSDTTEGARFSGTLGGESKDWNEGDYNGLKQFNMQPGDPFALVLVPNSTFEALAANPATTNTYKRPLFSFTSPNADYGMHMGQVADINGMGLAFVFEDMEFSNSDKDYNDLIIQINGASANVPALDEMLASYEPVSRKRSRTTAWHDWRISDELGRKIIEHIKAIPGKEDLRTSVSLDAPADLMIYDTEERFSGKDGGEIPGSFIVSDENSVQTVFLPKQTEDSQYRLVLRGLKDETGLLTIKQHQGNTEIFSDSKEISVESRQVLRSDLSLSLSGDVRFGEVEVPANADGGPLRYDFDADGRVDDDDINQVASLWNTCEGDREYNPFYDSDNDGCITILDIAPVSNGKYVP